MRALLIQHSYIDLILARKKKWEIRGSPTNVREQIGLIASGSLLQDFKALPCCDHQIRSVCGESHDCATIPALK